MYGESPRENYKLCLQIVLFPPVDVTNPYEYCFSHIKNLKNTGWWKCV